MTSVLIVAHRQRTEAAALTRAAAEWLSARGHEAWMPVDDAIELGLRHLGSDRPATDAGLALSLGGDGTMLRTIKLLDGAPVPIIGVNVGMLGYLAEVEPPALLPALERWFAVDHEHDHEHDHGDEQGDTGRGSKGRRGFDGGETSGWRIEERMMLQLTVERSRNEAYADPGQHDEEPDRPAEMWRALNEVVLEKSQSGHTVRLLVSIDDAPFTSYAADGLIIATPTGSTAYSLSARGPVVSPQHRAMLLTPVSPHMLFDRSLVLDPDEPVRVEVTGYRPVEVSVDGQRVATLGEGDTLLCVPAAETARFVRFGPRRFHQILKAKFGLTDR